MATTADPPAHENLIVFIHGFIGDGDKTWRNTSSGAYWPELLSSDPQFSSFQISTYSYTASLGRPGLTTNELGNQFAEFLRQKSQSFNSVFIIAHSYGGIVALDALIKLAESDQIVFDKFHGVFLLAVPFNGTHHVTKNLRYLVPSQIMGELQTIDTNSYLQALDSKWGRLIRTRIDEKKSLPQIHAAYEKIETRIVLFKRLLVDRGALFPYRDSDPYPVEKDHMQIAKPPNRQDVIYSWTAYHIQRIAEGYAPAVAADIDLKLSQSEFVFDTQSELPANIFSSKRLPAARIFTELPHATFSCFDYEQFQLINETTDYFVFSNEAASPPVILRFYYTKPKGNILIYLDDLKFNAASEKASYENRLDFLRFQRALTSNARLVFWDIVKGDVLFRTGHALPTKMERNENADVIEDIIQEIVRIERFFAIRFKLQTKYTAADLQKIKYIRDVLNGKEIIVGNTFELILKSEEEKQEFLKGVDPENYIGDYRYNFNFKHEMISLLGTTLDLGDRLIKVPAATFDPPPDVLKEKLNRPNQEAVEVKIQSGAPAPPIAIWHYRSMTEHELPSVILAPKPERRPEQR